MWNLVLETTQCGPSATCEVGLSSQRTRASGVAESVAPLFHTVTITTLLPDAGVGGDAYT